MITVNNAERYLKDKIGENTIDITKVWEVYKSFAKEHVEGEEETVLLFQCGVYDFTGEKLFHFDFVRQFTNGESGYMEQLHCEFVFEPTIALIKLEASEWYFDTDGELDDFFYEIENFEEFKSPLKYTPLRLNIYQEKV